MARVFGRSTSLLGGTSGGRGTGGRSDGLSPADSEDIVRRGYLKKYKNLRSRYYVLRQQGGAGSPAKLECYDSEQKFLDGAPAKRYYLMNQCISIHEKKDSKRPYAMSIFIKQDSCCLLAASAEDMSEWLEALQAAADTADWEHVWQVEVLARGLGGMHDGALAGHSYLCLTKRQLSLVKQHNYSQRTDVALSNIRGCSSTQHFFTLEMGRMAETGSGRLDLKVQDSNIASNIEIIVRQAMTELSKARDRTCSMSNTTSSHRDRSGSLPARPDSCGAAPSHSPGRWHPPWEESAPRLVDDGRGGLTLPCNRCPALRAGGGLDTYVLMDGTNTQQSTPYGGEVCNPCEAGCPSHHCSPIKGDERPPGDEQVAGAYLDMCQNIGRGTGVSSPSSTLSPVSPGLCTAHLHGHYSPGPLCCPVHCPPSIMSPRPAAVPTQTGGGYVNMAVAATLPKPIPGSGTQDGDASHSSECSSYTSAGGGGTPPPSQHLCLHHDDDLDMDVTSSRCRRHLRQDAQSGHLSLDNESVQDVEDVVDDALEGRLQGAGSAGDMDLDMDIDVDLDGDQVDGGVPMMRSYGGGSISARACLETSSNARHGGELREEDEARILRPQQLRPLRTSSVGSKQEHCRRKNSAPMLGISCASRSWSDTSGSYFRTLDKLNEDHLMLDFTQSHKSYDYIAPRHSTADEAKEKKSLSIERIKSTILRHRTTSKRKAKRVSEGEVKSSSYRSSGIEIPNSLHEDYFMVDMNSSPRSNASNMSNTSTNSDTAPPGYLSMRPGGSLSFSSTCSSEYISMEPITSSGGDTGRCQDATHASNCTCMTDTASDVDAYVDMSAGVDGGLSLSVESSSSGSVQSHQRRMSCTSRQNTSLELVSPQEEQAGLSYLYDMDNNTSQKDKRSRKKESGKRKKSDPLAVEGMAEALRSKGSGHLSSFTNLLSRKNSQNSTTRTPLSPTGSPLPKSSRSSNSPFASLGRSKSKDGRDSCPPNMSSSPTSGVANTHNSINTNCGNTLSPVIRDTDAIDDVRCSLRGVGGSFPRNHSSKELSELNKLASNRSSAPYDLTAGILRTGVGGLCSPCAHLPRCSVDKTPANWGAAAHHHQHRFQELNDRGREDPGGAVLNIVAGAETSNSPAVNASSFSSDRKCSCICTCIVYSKYPCTMLTEADKVGQTASHSSLSNSNPNSADLGRLSESSLEDSSRTSVFFNAVTPNVAQETANYVNMGPVSCVDNYLVLGDGSAGHVSSSALYTPRTEERKILNTDQGNNRCNSLAMACTVSSDYLDMDMRKNGTSTSTSNTSALTNSKCTCISNTPAPVPSLLIPQQSSASVKCTSASTVVRRPALPPLVLAAALRTDPLVPLERLSLVERVSEEPENKLPGAVTNTVSSVTQASDALLSQCCAAPDHNSGSFSERCRSHSGPGAPEASSFGTGNIKRSAGGDAGDRGRDGSSRALSACNSPVSYSPPTSPNLASSSKSSLSEGGMSSASSTCTVVNVGLRLQQQNHRHSHGSGSSMCTNADATTSVTVTTPNTSSSSAIGIVVSTSVVPSAIHCLDRSCASSQPETRFTAVQKIAQTISHLPRPPFTPAAPHEVEYACLDLAPPRGVTGSSNDGSPASKRRALPWLEGPSNTPSSSVSAAATTSPASGSTQSAPKEESNEYTEIDFQKSESLRNACMLAATLRH